MSANIWDEIRSRLRSKVNSLSFDTWFAPTRFVSDDGRSIMVSVPNLLFRDWIAKHYSGVIAEALEGLHRSDVRITFIVAEARDTDTRYSARFDRLDQELAAIRRDVDLIVAKLSST